MRKNPEILVSFTDKIRINIITANAAGLKNKRHWAAAREDGRIVKSGTIDSVIKYLRGLGFMPDAERSLSYVNTSSCPAERAGELQEIMS